MDLSPAQARGIMGATARIVDRSNILHEKAFWMTEIEEKPVEQQSELSQPDYENWKRDLLERAEYHAIVHAPHLERYLAIASLLFMLVYAIAEWR